MSIGNQNDRNTYFDNLYLCKKPKFTYEFINQQISIHFSCAFPLTDF